MKWKTLLISFALQGTPQPLVYDPLAPVNTDKLNMAYINRHLPTFANPLKMPVPLARLTS